jgi:hypothetical protein
VLLLDAWALAVNGNTSASTKRQTNDRNLEFIRIDLFRFLASNRNHLIIGAAQRK